MLAACQEGQDALSLRAVLMTQHLTSPPLPKADLSPGAELILRTERRRHDPEDLVLGFGPFQFGWGVWPTL